MAGLPFYMVDVFAEEKYAGNQLAVFRGGQSLRAEDMQRIAQEVHFSETTFIVSEKPRGGGFDVRIFTPAEELPFAGHPMLGTAHILQTEILKSGSDSVVLNCQTGPIPVSTVGSGKETVYWMKQNAPEFGRTHVPSILGAILGLGEDDIDPRFPIEEVSTGLPHILVPLRTLGALKRARVHQEKYFEFIKDKWAKAILVFSPEPHEAKNNIAVRMFADCFGIIEDPATGSGNGCLAAYLVRHRYWGNAAVDVRSEQGYEIGRPSLLYLRAKEAGDGTFGVSVGGKAVTVARGEFV